MSEFDPIQYGREDIIGELYQIQKHAVDGSATEAGCACIESKHFIGVEKQVSELIPMVSSKEKDFYIKLGDLSRELRKEIESESFEMHGIMRRVMKDLNPRPRRQYKPYAWTKCEKEHPKVQRKIIRCAEKIEKKQECPPDLWGTSKECVNPYAVCRAAIPCP